MRIAFLSLGLSIALSCNAAQLQVTVVDNRGEAVTGAVVVAIGVAAPIPKVEGIAVMDQVDKRFVPEVLIVRAGTAVSFPNSDSIAHQVYSFSDTKRFTLPLYRGRPHQPLVFDKPGIVVLGCNIHDQMIGYIYVTESPHFAMTDERGSVTLNSIPAGAVRLTMWHARLDERVDEQEIKLVESDSQQVTFRLQRSLRPKPRQIDDRIRDY